MLRTTVLILFAAGCMADEPELSAIEAAAIGERCRPDVCGTNSDDHIDGGLFYDLNLDGLPNKDGWYITFARQNTSFYDLNVINSRIVATKWFGSGPATLSGSALVGLKIRLANDTPHAGPPLDRWLEIQAFSKVTDFWAKHPDGAPTPMIESYKFVLSNDSGHSLEMCLDGALLMDMTSQFTKMPNKHALVYEGDRIDIDNLTVKAGSRWMTIGCARSALAKMHLNGHTRSAGISAGFTTTIAERQTFLKMLTADYCGIGYSMTVPKQPLFYTDDRGTLAQANGTKVIEARWDQHGAICLNTPRLLAHPSEASESEFPALEWLIELACGGDAPPPCGPFVVLPGPHLTSWNPTPFTN